MRACSFAFLMALTFGLTAHAQPKVIPSPEQLQTSINEALAQIPSYNSGDLLTRADVEQVLRTLNKEGVKLSKEKQDILLEKTLSDSSQLIKELSTPKGKEFVKKADANPLLYDQLDRIMQHQGGQRLVHDLIRLPDGWKYAREHQPPGAVNMREFLPKTSRGNSIPTRDYNQPTGRIYNEKQLFKELEQALKTDIR